ncbi:MAG: hypothetical protein WCV85_00555 [Patescibacteria group bacterium]|jgi:hypothetical protein
MAWHVDSEVQQALVKLNDALCTFERNTCRRYTLVLIPHAADELCHVSLSGKPISEDSQLKPDEAVAIAIAERGH